MWAVPKKAAPFKYERDLNNYLNYGNPHEIERNLAIGIEMWTFYDKHFKKVDHCIDFLVEVGLIEEVEVENGRN